jgi:PAS domain S-box-containing protein
MSHARADAAIIAGFQSALAACAVLESVRDPAGPITDFRIVAVNDSAIRLTGQPADALLGASIRGIPALAGLDDAIADYAAVADGGAPRVDEFRLTQGGAASVCWVDRTVTRTASGVLVVVRDVTERRNAEEMSRKRGALLEAVVQSIADFVFVKDVEGRYLLMIGDDPVHMVGPEQVVGRRDEDFEAGYARQRRESDVRVMETGQVETYEYDHLVNGQRCTRSVTKAPYRAVDGTIVGVVGVVRDVTAIRRLEAQVQQAQKMEAVGRLAGGIAHDFNNLLTAILSFATLASETLPVDHDAQADLTAIRRAGEGAAVLTRQMLAFSRRQLMAPRPLLLNDVVQNTERLLRSLVGELVTIDTALDPDLTLIDGDASQIEQVLVNLVVNAGHSMPTGGTVWVDTANVRLTAADAARFPALPPGLYARLSVRDTGIGMDETTRLRAFEPFFTTKPEGQGTGLGLATVYGIVQQSRGGVFVESQPGAGSEFAVYLPAAVDAASAPSPTSALARAGLERGYETVLLVEDNAFVRQAEERILSEAGYRVFVGTTGVEALELVASLDGAIDLLITDLFMPEIGGRALLARLREDWPGLRALLVSGHDRGEATDAVSLPSETEFLHKPFTADAFLRAVRTLLDLDR